MSYEHDLVDRAVKVLAPEGPSFEGLLRRRDQKRRNQRLAAAAIGIGVGIGIAVGFGAAYLRSAADQQRVGWPQPRVTETPLLHPDEVLLSPYPPEGPTSVIAVDVSSGARRAVDGCAGSCGAMSGFDASADRGWIAYHLWSCGECRPVEPESGLWVVGVEAKPRLVLMGGQEIPWSWSPTGAQLAYADGRTLILLDPTTWDHARIVVAGGRIGAIAWGPDGRAIAYSVEQADGAAVASASFGVFVVRSGDDPERVSSVVGQAIEWSPDGDWLLIDRIDGPRSQVAVVAADGSSERVLAEGPQSDGPNRPVWSPDGTRIAFLRTPREGEGFGLEFWVVGADGRGSMRLGVGDPETWLGDGPVWSPDSRLVAWSSNFGTDWVAVDAGGGTPTSIDRLEAERWRQG